MDRKGRAFANVLAERLWHSVKYDYIYLDLYQDGLSL